MYGAFVDQFCIPFVTGSLPSTESGDSLFGRGSSESVGSCLGLLGKNEGTNSTAFTFNVENLPDKSAESEVSPAPLSSCSQLSGAAFVVIIEIVFIFSELINRKIITRFVFALCIRV